MDTSSWQTGDYEVQLRLEDTAYEGWCGFLYQAPASVQSAYCEGEAWELLFTAYADGLLTAEMTASIAYPRGQRPTEVTVDLRVDGADLDSQTVAIEYTDKRRPNGPDCGPVCWSAHALFDTSP